MKEKEDESLIILTYIVLFGSLNYCACKIFLNLLTKVKEWFVGIRRKLSKKECMCTWSYANDEKKTDQIHFIMGYESECCYNQNAIKKCQNRYCMGKLINKIIYYIDSARSLICIAANAIDGPEIANSLIAAHQRGVSVRIILWKERPGFSYEHLKKSGKRSVNGTFTCPF